MHSFDSDADIFEAMGPGAADKALRDAIQLCWMAMPKEKKSLPELKTLVEKLLDRVFRDLNEDEQYFRGG